MGFQLLQLLGQTTWGFSFWARRHGVSAFGPDDMGFQLLGQTTWGFSFWARLLTSRPPRWCSGEPVTDDWMKSIPEKRDKETCMSLFASFFQHLELEAQVIKRQGKGSMDLTLCCTCCCMEFVTLLLLHSIQLVLFRPQPLSTFILLVKAVFKEPLSPKQVFHHEIFMYTQNNNYSPSSLRSK